MTTHDVIRDFLPPLLGMLGCMLCTNKHMFFQHHISSHHGDKWILCLQ